ncbi:MAG: N-acetyltransferase [Parvularculaceae bacterium]|nr:N-acetyltransferase [Parvularculaceae bacterium]
MSESKIVLHATAEGGRYAIETPHGRAELDYEVNADGDVVIIHTYSPPAARGRGLARQLVERAVADAREKGVKVAPECSYAARLFSERADWASLRA